MDKTKNKAWKLADSVVPLRLTPSEVYEMAMKTCLPAGTYTLMNRVAMLYDINLHGDRDSNQLFMLAAAFVAGYVYADNEGSEQDG